jgi:tetratricopeptide (TPR) repeat protein
VIGWTADFFRFWWALAYWNLRKTWFRLHGGHRDSCPCQNYGDSGLALDARCEAVADWNSPRRFRKVCPLLTETKQGWRCGADAERVRPFWLRAFAYGGGALLALYLLATLGVHVALRATGYEVSYLTVVWPPRWPELRHSQELLYAMRAREAMAAGDYQAAILSLQTVCLLNPQNSSAGLTLAHLLQLAGQSAVAEHTYQRLMQDVPEQRAAIAQVWIRLLLARANYTDIKPLAMAMLSEDSSRREAWLHALVFSVRQSNDPAALDPLLSGEHGLPNWSVDLVRLEQQILRGKTDRALPGLTRLYPATTSPYVPFYQADRLLRLGYADQAANLVDAYGKFVPPDVASLLRLRAYRMKGWTSLVDSEFEGLMQLPLSSRTATLCSAYLLEWPDRAEAARFLQRFITAGPALSGETLPLYQAVFLVAITSGLTDRAAQVMGQISVFTKSDGKALHGLGELLRTNPAAAQLAQLLPSVSLPIEAIYALQTQARSPASPPAKS